MIWLILKLAQLTAAAAVIAALVVAAGMTSGSVAVVTAGAKAMGFVIVFALLLGALAKVLEVFDRG